MAWAARHKAPPVLAGSFLVELHNYIRPLTCVPPFGPQKFMNWHTIQRRVDAR